MLNNCVFFLFLLQNMHKNKAFMKTLNKKIAYQHTNHSQLLNWAKMEGSDNLLNEEPFN